MEIRAELHKSDMSDPSNVGLEIIQDQLQQSSSEAEMSVTTGISEMRVQATQDRLIHRPHTPGDRDTATPIKNGPTPNHRRSPMDTSTMDNT